MEKEFKLMLSRDEYEKLIAECKQPPYQQTNYYFLIDETEKRMLRLRRSGDMCEATYKRLERQADGVFTSRESNMPVSLKVFQNIMQYGMSAEFCNEIFSLSEADDLPCLGQLATLRAKFDWHGFTIEVDRSDYLFMTDFELEFECDDDSKIAALKKQLEKEGITGRPSESKSKRFSDRKRFLTQKKYGCVLIDFDGTLCNTELGIIHCITKTCSAFGLDVSGRDLSEFFGPPITEIYTTLLGAERAVKAREIHREIYFTEGYKMCKVYDGITDVLAALSQKGIKIAVATARTEDSAQQIAAEHGIAQYLPLIFGLVDGVHENKPAVIRDALDAVNTDKTNCIMVGDRFHDLRGAEANGIDAAGVLYGYGTEAELAACNSVGIVKSVKELWQFLDIVT